MSTDGKWMVSSNEERWDDGEEFDTQEEAISYALGEFADEYGLESGDRVYVGQVVAITPQDMAEYAIDAERILQDVDQMLYERVGDEVQNELCVTTPQGDDLEKRLRETFVQWCADYQISAPCYSIDNVRRFVVGETVE